MRILHVGDRLSDRGGADLAILGLLDALARPYGRVGSLRARDTPASPVVRRRLLAAGHEQHLAVGRDDGVVRPPCPVTVVPGLDARTRVGGPSRARWSLRSRGAPGVARPAAQTPGAELDPLLARLRPDVVHVHNVVNPAVLAWAAGVDAVVTIQDHRFFCPGRGKWTADGSVCGEAMGRETCAGCFDDPAYFEAVLELTAERLEAVKQLRLTVLSSYMKRELVQAGDPRGPRCCRSPGGLRPRPERESRWSALRALRGPRSRGEGYPRGDRRLAALAVPAALRRRRHRPVAPRDRGRGRRGAGLARPPEPLRGLPARRRARDALPLAGAVRHRRAGGPHPRHAGGRLGTAAGCANGTPAGSFWCPGGTSTGWPPPSAARRARKSIAPPGFEPGRPRTQAGSPVRRTRVIAPTGGQPAKSVPKSAGVAPAIEVRRPGGCGGRPVRTSAT